METAPSFYKILLDLSSHLRLPQGFTQKYPEILISRKAKLRIDSGATWEVRGEKLEDHYFFTKGWANFLQEMGLRRFELLVFAYAGDSTFHVTIYEANACEKDSNSRVNHNPRFQILMMEHHYHIMHVPRHFYEAADLKGGEKVLFEYGGGESVEVALNVWTSGGRLFMNLGEEWKEFWEKNKLNVGKAYCFEFLPAMKVIRVKPSAEVDHDSAFNIFE